MAIFIFGFMFGEEGNNTLAKFEPFSKNKLTGANGQLKQGSIYEKEGRI